MRILKIKCILLRNRLSVCAWRPLVDIRHNRSHTSFGSSFFSQMAFKVCSKVASLAWIKPQAAACGSLRPGCGFMVQHDRQNQRFTATPSSGVGKSSVRLRALCRGQGCSREPGVRSRPPKTARLHQNRFPELNTTRSYMKINKIKIFRLTSRYLNVYSSD